MVFFLSSTRSALWELQILTQEDTTDSSAQLWAQCIKLSRAAFRIRFLVLNLRKFQERGPMQFYWFVIKHLQGTIWGSFFFFLEEKLYVYNCHKDKNAWRRDVRSGPQELRYFCTFDCHKTPKARLLSAGQKETGVQSEAKPGFKARPPNPPIQGFATHQFASLLCYFRPGILTGSSIFMAFFSLIKWGD